MRRVAIAAVLLLGSPPLHAPGPWPANQGRAASPQSVGLDSAKLAAIDADITAGKYGNVDGFLVIRHGKVAFDRSYKQNYDSIYGADAKKPGPLNAHDFTGPYNYFNPWWHP